MIKCLYCGLEAAVSNEDYNGIPLLVCAENHRTGILPEEEKDQSLKVA